MKKIIIGLILIIVLFASSVVLSLNNYDIEETIICSVNDNAHLIPSEICEYYLLNFRANKKDISFLENRAGLSFLINIENKNKRELLFDFLISKGLDINGKSKIDGLTPLHAAILSNDNRLVSYLLNKKADPLILDRDNKLNAQDFLQLLINKNPTVDRSAIELLLNKSP